MLTEKMGAIGAVALLALSVACAGPSTSRSGSVHDIRVTEGPEPADLVVNPGDEVRWVNARNMAVRVDLVNVNVDELSCQRGFANFFGVSQESSTIEPNRSVSICPNKAGVINYNLRMESALPGGQKIVPGVIRIGGMQ